MAAFLVFQIKAPLASFGASLGMRRTTSLRPTRSAVLGLLAAALGIERDDREAYTQLDKGLALAHAELAAPQVLVDFHTVQLPTSLRGYTRREQMEAGDVNCEPSQREYLQNGHWLVAVQGEPALLERCRAALEAPVFTLYVGRKSCPLSAFTAPLQVDADNVEAAMRAWHAAQTAVAEQYKLGDVPSLDGVTLCWDATAKVAAQESVRHVRHDRRLSLAQLHFVSNVEHEGRFAAA